MSSTSENSPPTSNLVLALLASATFLVLFQVYLIAPLIPSLSIDLHASVEMVGYVVPAYLIPYGISTLFYGPLSDRVGRRPVLLALMGLTVVTTLITAWARTAQELIVLRIFAGLIAGGIVPIAVAMIGDLFAYQRRGKAMGWIFGAVAGGMAFGSTGGAFLNPIIGWRNEFRGLAVLNAILFGIAYWKRAELNVSSVQHITPWRALFSNYLSLVRTSRGLRTYLYISINGIFHSGVFSWLGLYFSQRYQLGDQGIGLALLGYGVPGMFLGPTIGHAADRVGRRWIVPAGLAVGALCALAFIPQVPLLAAVLISVFLSLGFDMSHPLLVGIVTDLNPKMRGLAVGLNAFVLFVGMGLGALLFQHLLVLGFTGALACFAGVQMIIAAAAGVSMKEEKPRTGPSIKASN